MPHNKPPTGHRRQREASIKGKLGSWFICNPGVANISNPRVVNILRQPKHCKDCTSGANTPALNQGYCLAVIQSSTSSAVDQFESISSCYASYASLLMLLLLGARQQPATVTSAALTIIGAFIQHSPIHTQQPVAFAVNCMQVNGICTVTPSQSLRAAVPGNEGPKREY